MLRILLAKCTLWPVLRPVLGPFHLSSKYLNSRYMNLQRHSHSPNAINEPICNIVGQLHDTICMLADLTLMCIQRTYCY